MGLKISLANQTQFTLSRIEWEPVLAEEVKFEQTLPEKLEEYDAGDADTEDTSMISFAGTGAAALKCVYEVEGVKIGFNASYPGTVAGYDLGDLKWSYLGTPDSAGKSESWINGGTGMVTVNLAKGLVVTFTPDLNSSEDLLSLSIVVSSN